MNLPQVAVCYLGRPHMAQNFSQALTAFDGHSITYDGSGNPLSYYNGKRYTMTWRNGRELDTATVGGKTYRYEYDVNGMRTRKTNSDSGYTQYYIVDGLTVAEQCFSASGVEQYTLRYLYDESNSPVGFGIQYPSEATWQNYYFAKNLQGDIIALYRQDYNSSTSSYYGTLVATYQYDPWGKPIGIYSASGTSISQTAANVAAYNPLRYRGYRYDVDTGFYYLQSRYYDPQICRFINADSYASNGMGSVGYNMFAYCLNNPAMYSDALGHAPTSTIDIDGDGEDECHVYEYTKTIIKYYRCILTVTTDVSGSVYIYTGVDTSFFEDSSNWPEGFDPETDLLVGDFTNQDNPCMYAYQAQKVNSRYRENILDCLLQYDTDFNTDWDRTKKSLMTEWKGHHSFQLFSKSAQNIDFDNAEEGKSYWYYTKKAVSRGVSKIKNFFDSLF